MNEHRLVSSCVVVGIPHADKEKGQMAAICLKLKNTQIKNILKGNKIKVDILEYLIRNMNFEDMPLGGIHFIETFPQTTCGKIRKIELVKTLINNYPK